MCWVGLVILREGGKIIFLVVIGFGLIVEMIVFWGLLELLWIISFFKFINMFIGVFLMFFIVVYLFFMFLKVV